MVLKKNLKDYLTLGTSNLVAGLIFGLFWLFLASLLDPSDYGELTFLMSIVNIFTTISLVGFRQTILVYEPKKENVIPGALVLTSIIASASAIVAFMITQSLLVSLLIVGLSIFNLTIVGLNSKEKYLNFAKHVLIRAAVTTSLAIILFHFFDINGIFLAYFVSTMFILIELRSFGKNRKIEFTFLKTHIKFLLYSFANRLSRLFLRWGDKLVIGTLFGFSLLGNYHFAAQYFVILEIIPRSMSQYLLPREASGKKNKNMKILSILISCLVALISIFVVPYGVDSFLPKYHDSIVPIQIMSIGIIPLSISSILHVEFLAKENSKIVLIGSVFSSGLYLLLIIILGQIWGVIGFAIGFLVATIFRMIFYLIMKFRYKKQSEQQI